MDGYSCSLSYLILNSVQIGIGKDIAITLHKEGATVYALSKTPANLQKLENECPGIITITWDLGDWKATERENLEPLNFLVNNAGLAVNQKLSESTEESFDF